MKHMTREQLIEKGKKYDKFENEGGEGFNPYWSELARREENQKRDAMPKTKKEEISILHDKIRIECGSIAREWGGEEAEKKQAAYYAEIRNLESEIEKEFAKEWTEGITQQRRESWNAFVGSITNSRGQITDPAKMHKQAKEQGWSVDDLRKAVKLHAK